MPANPLVLCYQFVDFTASQVHGAFGICVISADDPDMLIGARRGSPLILGIGSDEFILASDAAAVIERTKHVSYLQVSVSISRQKCTS